MSFFTGTQSEVLYVLPAAVTKNTFTTAAAITGVAGTNTVCSIPPGFLMNENPNPVGKVLLLNVFGTIANTAAATFGLTVNMNTTPGTSATSVTVAGTYTPTAATTAPWWLQAFLTCTTFTTSSATYQINGTFREEATASGAAPGTSALTGGFSGTLTGDPRVTQYVELFGTWSASSASNTTTVQQMILSGLN